jgi:signal transduction protein with GAF and PtsI domain
MDAAGGQAVVFRTLDIGSDKVLPYMKPQTSRTRRWAGGRSGSGSTSPA